MTSTTSATFDAPRIKHRSAALTLPRVYVVLAILLFAIAPLLVPIHPHDFWWHLATGRMIVTEGSIPTHDTFSFTQAGQPFFNQSWLAQVLMYGLHRLAGVELVLLVHSLIVTTTFGLLLRLCIRRTGRKRLSVLTLLLASFPVSMGVLGVRPQAYAFPLFAGFLYVLTDYRLSGVPGTAGIRTTRTQSFFRRSRKLWLLPLLMLVWVNVHGSFLLGVVLIAIVLAGEGGKRWFFAQPALARTDWWTLCGWGALTAAAVLFNPRGPAVLGYVANLLGNEGVRDLVTEWAPPAIHDGTGLLFFLSIVVALLLFMYTRERPDLSDLLPFMAFLVLALTAVRNVAWFAIVATPFLVAQASTLARRPPPEDEGILGGNIAIVALLAVVYLVALPWVKPTVVSGSAGQLVTADTPVAATEFLRAQPDRPERLFHDLGYGSYLIWAAPEQKVFIDTRIELYPAAQLVDYIKLSQGANVAQLLADYDIDGVLASKTTQAELAEWLRDSDDWRLAYEDATTVYYRSDAAGGP